MIIHVPRERFAPTRPTACTPTSCVRAPSMMITGACALRELLALAPGVTRVPFRVTCGEVQAIIYCVPCVYCTARNPRLSRTIGTQTRTMSEEKNREYIRPDADLPIRPVVGTPSCEVTYGVMPWLFMSSVCGTRTQAFCTDGTAGARAGGA